MREGVRSDEVAAVEDAAANAGAGAGAGADAGTGAGTDVVGKAGGFGRGTGGALFGASVMPWLMASLVSCSADWQPVSWALASSMCLAKRDRLEAYQAALSRWFKPEGGSMASYRSEGVNKSENWLARPAAGPVPPVVRAVAEVAAPAVAAVEVAASASGTAAEGAVAPGGGTTASEPEAMVCASRLWQPIVEIREQSCGVKEIA